MRAPKHAEAVQASPPDPRSVLLALSAADDFETILSLDPAAIAAAAAAGLAALEGQQAPRVESRAERLARMRERHPRAYEAWTEEEDARLLFRHAEGATVAELAGALGRQPNAIRLRLEKWLGADWKQRAQHSETKPGP